MRTKGFGFGSLLVLAAFAVLGAAAARPAHAASDYLLEIDGIKGESTDARYKDAIEIESFSFGATNPGSAGSGGGAGSGKVQFQDIHFTKRIDRSSPQLLKALATGKHIKKATLTVRKAGKDQQEYYKVTLEDVLISSYNVSGAQGSARAVPADQFSLSYSKISTVYTPDGATGGTPEPVEAFTAADRSSR